MTVESQVWESSVLRNLQRASEARGLKFYSHPPRDVLPDFLGGYRPDAIALGPQGGTIFKVKHRNSRSADRQLAALAQTVAGQAGWEFRVIYLNPSTDEVPTISRPTAAQIHNALEEVEALAKGDHNAAALVAGWALLESLARLATAGGESQRPTDFSPVQTVQRLAEEGYLEGGDADRLRAMARLRNAVVHGDLSTEVPAAQVNYLLRQLRALMSDIISVQHTV